MSELSRDAVLQRVRDLEVRINSSNEVMIRHRGKWIGGGPFGLSVLESFQQPRSLGQVLGSHAAQLKGVEAWKTLTATIVRFSELGILRDPSQGMPAPRLASSGYERASIHIEMLDDRARTEAFIAGIEATVRPGDVVVEIGTGTGILAVAAARAGAGHVYALEETAIADTAQQVFHANLLADRITLVRGDSRLVELEQRADVLVSEVIGNDPLGERILEIYEDAVRRHLKPEGRLVPRAISIYGLPLEIPDDVRRRHRVQARSLEEWRSWYGIDLSPLETVGRGAAQAFLHNPYRVREWRALSDPVLLTRVDLKTFRGAVVDETSAARATESGRADGVLVFFEAELAPGVIVSTDPAKVSPDTAWGCAIWLVPDPLSLRRDEPFELEYTYNTKDVPFGVRLSRSADNRPGRDR